MSKTPKNKRKVQLQQSSLDHFFVATTKRSGRVVHNNGSSPTHFGNPFSILPRTLMLKILFYVHDGSCDNVSPFSWRIPVPKYKDGLRGLISFATCDKYCETLVYKDLGAVVWEEVDLSYSRISDFQLSAFLQRINAVKVTKRLSLFDCPLIEGTGLLPVTGSQVLDLIDLRTKRVCETGVTGLDDRVVSTVLSSLLPSKLDFVHFHGYADPPGSLSFEMGGFVMRLALAKARRLVDFDIKCSHCDCQLSTFVSTEKVLANCYRETMCYICKSTSCEPWDSTKDCVRIRPCSNCLKPCCTDCSDKCPQCTTYFCRDCAQQLHCVLCNKFCCYEYRFSDTFQCDNCEQVFCDDCSIEFVCDRCNRAACESCRQYRSLSCVKGRFNEKCRFDHQCHGCGGFEDLDDISTEECVICFNNVCSECSHHHTCTPPWELTFWPRNIRGLTGYAKMCSCGQVPLDRAKGQQFMCGFVRKSTMTKDSEAST